ncbi:MAG: GerW family sporulation protein [Ruminococcus sp.]|jgi:sporulation protein YtfJ|nr:GerW family sporulation protein [Ruminococcus sp.]
MSDHPINGLMDTTMDKIKQMVDVNTIIGDPITTPEGTIIIPVSKVTYGFASGGSDFPTKKENKECFGGGSGAGITIQPVAFLTVYRGDVKLISLEKYDGAVDRVVGMVPDLVDKVSALFKKDKKDVDVHYDIEAETADEDDLF